MSDLPLTCAQARRLNHLELDGALSPDQSQALRTHCEQCPRCRRDRQTLFALQAALIRARFAFRRRAPAAPDMSGRVIASLQAQPRRQMWRTLSGVLTHAATLTAAVVIAAGGRLPADVSLPVDPTPPPAVVRPSAPASGRLVTQTALPAFEFEDEAGQSIHYTVLPGGSEGDDSSAPGVPSGPARLRMN